VQRSELPDSVRIAYGATIRHRLHSTPIRAARFVVRLLAAVGSSAAAAANGAAAKRCHIDCSATTSTHNTEQHTHTTVVWMALGRKPTPLQQQWKQKKMARKKKRLRENGRCTWIVHSQRFE